MKTKNKTIWLILGLVVATLLISFEQINLPFNSRLDAYVDTYDGTLHTVLSGKTSELVIDYLIEVVHE